MNDLPMQFSIPGLPSADPAPPLRLSSRELHIPSAQFDRQVDKLDGPQGGGGGERQAPQPFDITLRDNGDGTSTATIWPGMVAGMLVSNYLSGVSVSNTGTYYLVVNCSTADGQIAAAELDIDSSYPSSPAVTPGAPPVAFKILVGVIVDGVAFKTLANMNVGPRAVEWFRILKETPTPGLPVYDIYYTWSW